MKVYIKIYALLFFGFLLFSSHEMWGETLSFDQAVIKTLSLSPKLRIAGSEVNEAVGAQVQSGLYPNPVAGWSVENVFGNKNSEFRKCNI